MATRDNATPGAKPSRPTRAWRPPPSEPGPSTYATHPPPSTSRSPSKSPPCPNPLAAETHRAPSPPIKRKGSHNDASPGRIYPGFLARRKDGGAVKGNESDSDGEFAMQIRSPVSPEAETTGLSAAGGLGVMDRWNAGRRISESGRAESFREAHPGKVDGEAPSGLPYLRPGSSSPGQRSSRIPSGSKLSGSAEELGWRPTTLPSTNDEVHQPDARISTRKDAGGETGNPGGVGALPLAEAASNIGAASVGKKPGRRRPAPLDLTRATGQPGIDPELKVHMDEINSATSAISIATSNSSSLTHELDDLSALRSAFRQNLRDRPIDTPLFNSGSDGSGFSTPGDLQAFPAGSTLSPGDYVQPSQLADMLAGPTTSDCVVIDTRPLGSYLDGHLPLSLNISIPSLIFKRLKKGAGTKPTWGSLAAFVTTPEGRDIWDGALDPGENRGIKVVLLGHTSNDDVAASLLRILREIEPRQEIVMVDGGWQGVTGEDKLSRLIIYPGTEGQGEEVPAESTPPAPTANHPNASEPSFTLAPPTPPSIPVPRLANQASMPSLREKRGLPNLPPPLDVGGGFGSTDNGARSPRLALNIGNPPRSATTGSFPTGRATGGLKPLKSPGLSLLTIDTSMGKGQSSKQTSFPFSPTSDPRHSSFQTACHEQSKQPPSPASFGDVTKSFARGMGEAQPRGLAVAPGAARPIGVGGPTYTVEPDSFVSSVPVRTGVPHGLPTVRNALSPFIVSTILPGFLFLGPEIANEEDMATLKKLGVKRVLNVALECEDEGELGIRDRFDKYLKVPMRDMVEESGVGKGIRDSCDFLDDARLHDAPTYVHCKAGKSRSVTVVLAYLIHANAWTLKTSYAYVSERRKGISPNIGFVAELMQYEETELGLKQSGGVHGEVQTAENDPSSGAVDDGTGSADGEKKKSKNKAHLRYARESLPPTWGSLDSAKPKRMDLGTDDAGPDAPGEMGQAKKEDEDDKDKRWVDEREVRKNGQWVHHRRYVLILDQIPSSDELASAISPPCHTSHQLRFGRRLSGIASAPSTS